MRRLLLISLIPFALVSCATDRAPTAFERTTENQERLDQRLGGLRSTGRSSCVPAFQARQQSIIDERTILFYTGRSPVYRAEIRNCPALDRNSTIIRRSTLPQICENEIFEVRDSGTLFPRGSCTFDEITRYERGES